MKIAAWVLGIVALATVAAWAQSGQDKNDLSDAPLPSRAFCRAAADYDKAVAKGMRIPLARHVELSRAIADTAPADTKADATLVWRSYVKLQAGDRSVVDNASVKAAVDAVNRRATQTCGWFKREGL